MRTWLVVLALAGCKKGQESAPSQGSQGSGSSVQVAPADAQPGDIATVSPDAPVVADALKAAGPAPIDPDKLLDVEKVGPLRWDQPEADVIKALGTPQRKKAPEEEGATGMFVSTWTWPDIDIEMAADTAKGPWKVRLITVKAPTGPQARGPLTYATARGIKLGSSRTDVAAAYPESAEGDKDPNEFLVGSPYGGLLFRFKSGVVAEMLLGPMAF